MWKLAGCVSTRIRGFCPNFFFGLKKFVILKKPVATLQSQEMEISKSGSLLHYSHKHVWKIVLWHSCHFHNIFERHLYSKDDSFVFHNTTTVPKKGKDPIVVLFCRSELSLEKWALSLMMYIVMKNIRESIIALWVNARFHISWCNWTY